MSEHLTQNQVEGYCQQRLSAADLLAVSDHLHACESCRSQIESELSGDAAFFTLRTEVFGEGAELPTTLRAHLSAGQTADYVDGRLAGEELQVVTDHLASCESCVLAADDLRVFREEVTPSLEHEYHPASLLAPAEPHRRRLVGFLHPPLATSPRLAFVAALTLLLLVFAGWFIWRTARDTKPTEEIVVTPTPTTEPDAVPSVAQLVAQLNDGEGSLTLDQEGKLSGAENLPPAYQSMVRDVLTNQRIERSPLLKGLARPPSALMSGDNQSDKFSAIEPVGKVLLTERPTFRWSKLAEAMGYLVEVYDSKFNIVATSERLTSNSWAAPRPLQRGRIYSWQVKAIKGGEEIKAPSPPARQAKFSVLDQAKANELVQARQAYPSSHLALGLLYARAGLVEEAEEEFRALEKANPESEIVRKLLASVRAMRR